MFLRDNSAQTAGLNAPEGTVYRPHTPADGSSVPTFGSSAPADGSSAVADGSSIPASGSAADAAGTEFTLSCPERNPLRAYHQEDAYDALFEMVPVQTGRHYSHGDAWIGQVDLHGAAWGIPPDRINGFKNQLAQTKTLFAEVKSAGHNSVNTEQCRLSFWELELAMQFLKANYFNAPPRTSDELTALLLALHDGSSTPIHPSDVVPGLSLHNTDGHGMLIKLFMDAVPSDKRSADHFFDKWGLKPVGRWATPEETAADPRLLTRPPTQAADLSMHFSTSRKWHELSFSLADLRLEVFVTACWQPPRNQDGPYCPIVSRIIA